MLIENELEKRLSEFPKSDIAEHLGISRPTLNKRLDDISSFTVYEWNNLCELIRLPSSFVLLKLKSCRKANLIDPKQVILDLFLLDACKLSTGDFTPSKTLHDVYTDFCKQYDQSDSFTRRELAYRMVQKGFTSIKRRYNGWNTMCWNNIQLKKDVVPLPEDEGEIIFG